MKNAIIYKFLPFIFLFITIACGPSYPENKAKYNIRIGEELQIYGTTNSCCCYTLCNESDLKHLKYIGKEVVKSDGESIGGNYTVAKKFEAISSGTDTVILAITMACHDCGHNSNEKYEVYTVNIE